jgi:hypothetical protein
MILGYCGKSEFASFGLFMYFTHYFMFYLPFLLGKMCCVCRLIILVGLCGKHSWEGTRHGGLYLRQTVTTFAEDSVSGLNLVILVSYCWTEKWWHFIFLCFRLSNEQCVLCVSGALFCLHASLFTVTVLCWQQEVKCLPLFSFAMSLGPCLFV